MVESVDVATGVGKPGRCAGGQCCAPRSGSGSLSKGACKVLQAGTPSNARAWPPHPPEGLLRSRRDGFAVVQRRRQRGRGIPVGQLTQL